MAEIACVAVVRVRCHTLTMEPASKDIEKALAQLREDPSAPVRARLDGLTVEIRAVDDTVEGRSAADAFDALGAWEGESTEEILQILSERRRQGGTRPVLSL